MVRIEEIKEKVSDLISVVEGVKAISKIGNI